MSMQRGVAVFVVSKYSCNNEYEEVQKMKIEKIKSNKKSEKSIDS